MIASILAHPLFRIIVWPLVRDEVVKFVQRYLTDKTFQKEMDGAIHVSVNAESAEEKQNASKLIQKALSRR